MDKVRFMVDSMLGNVARELRLLGYDVLYAKKEDDPRIIRLAQAESRILLTRDRELIHRVRGLPSLLVEEGDPKRQTAAALKKLGRNPSADGVGILTRCLEDGSLLMDAQPEEVADRVPPYVAATQKRFSVCGECARIYWHGTHAERMMKRAAEILKGLLE